MTVQTRKSIAALISMLLTVSLTCGQQPGPSAQDEWMQLFNGQTMEGWTPKIAGYPLGENVGNTFRVEDGVLKASYDRYDAWDNRFGHLFYREPFSHYRIRVEYRFVGDQVPGGPGWAFRNSGIMFHCQDPATMQLDQDFPVSIEAQLLGGGGTGERPTMNVCSPGTHIVMHDTLVTRHCNNSTSKTYHGDQWVTAELEVHGNGLVRHIVEGETVLEYSRPQIDPRDEYAAPLIRDGNTMISGGYISLQSESHPIEFRKVELKRLAE